MIHTLVYSASLPLARPAVFDFFADARNLARITPPRMGMHIRTPGAITIRQGTEIEYGLRVFGRSLVWRSLISRWEPPREFVDEQLAGPYKTWVHTHRFTEADGLTTVEDSVCYELPWQPCGELANPLVRRQLNQIFRYRQQAIDGILLGAATPNG